MTWESTGTISVTTNSTAVMGVGTLFTQRCRVGDGLVGPDGRFYEIINIVSSTTLAISPNYLGPTAADVAYKIIPVQGYSKAAADQVHRLIGVVEDSLGEWSADTVSEAEARAGVSEVRRAWSALRVRQCIDSVIGIGAGLILRAGAGGWLGRAEKNTVPIGYPQALAGSVSQMFRSDVADGTVTALSTGIHMAVEDSWGRLRVSPASARAWIQGGNAVSKTGWTAELYHSGNTLKIGTTAAAARTALLLGTSALKNIGTDVGDVLAVGAGGWLGRGAVEASSLGNPPTILDSRNATRAFANNVVGHTIHQYSSAIHFAGGNTWGRLHTAHSAPRAWLQGGSIAWDGSSTSGWLAELFHTENTLALGKTAKTARTALELNSLGTGWVDLRPYLEAPFYWRASREGINSHPRIRKLPCGRVELDGIVSFNETAGPWPLLSKMFRVPAGFRPQKTTAGVVFGDITTPLSFGAATLIVSGEVDYGGSGTLSGEVRLMTFSNNMAGEHTDGSIILTQLTWFLD